MNPYIFTNGSEFFFEFITDQGIAYNAIFFGFSSMFTNYPGLSKDVYSFTLDIVSGDISSQNLDERIGQTIVAIFWHFFSFRQNVVVYICDSSDDRQLARKKKFDLWFWKYNDGTIIKEDGVAVIADFEIYNSILVHKQNQLADKIITAFKTLNERADDK